MSENKGVIRTKRAIRDAFLDLVEEKKDIRKITISELTEKSDIVRSTFYAHYKDIYAVEEEIVREVIDHFDNTFKITPRPLTDNCAPLIRTIIELIRQNESDYRKILLTNNAPVIIENIKNSLCRQLLIYSPGAGDPHVQLKARFLANSFVDIVKDSLLGNISANLLEIQAFILRIVDFIKATR